MQKLLWIASLIVLLNEPSLAKDNYESIQYFNQPFGNIHQNASKYSSVLTTVACAHPIKVYARKLGDWVKVKVGATDGFIMEKYLSDKKVKCFQDKYPRFFDQFQLGPTELYYWGRLYDQYAIGKSKVGQ